MICVALRGGPEAGAAGGWGRDDRPEGPAGGTGPGPTVGEPGLKVPGPVGGEVPRKPGGVPVLKEGGDPGL